MDMREEEARYQDMQRSGNYTREEMLKEIKEVTKKEIYMIMEKIL